MISGGKSDGIKIFRGRHGYLCTLSAEAKTVKTLVIFFEVKIIGSLRLLKYTVFLSSSKVVPLTQNLKKKKTIILYLLQN